MSNVFPQNGDNDSGSNFSIWLNRENISDYIHTGIQFINVDYTNLNFDLSEGHCFISYNNEDKVVYIEPSEFTGISLSDNATNHVFLDVDFSTNNSVSVLVNTTSSAPSGAYIKLGEIDTSNNTTTEMNRDPALRGRSATFDSLTLQGTHDLNGNDLADGTTTIWDTSAQYVPETQVEQGSGSGLNADLVDGSHASDLGSSVSDDGTTIVSPATDINFASNISVTDDGDGTVTVDGASGTSVSDDGTLIVDGVSDVNFSNNISVTDDGDGTVTVDGASGTSVSDNGNLVVSGVSDINFDSYLNVTDDGDGTVTLDVGDNWVDTAGDTMGGVLGLGGNNLEDGTTVIWDATNQNIDSTLLDTDSVTVTAGNQLTGGGAVSLGGSVTIDVDEGSGSGLDADLLDGNESSAFAQTSGATFSGDITMSDDYDINFGTNSDFEMFYQSSNDRLVLEDGSGTQLMHAYKSGVVDFVNGIDVGVIEAPTDSLTELINEDITSSPSSGTVVGYTFAVNSETILGIQADADGSGGVTDKEIDFHQNEAENFVLDGETGDPSAPVVGQIWYRTDLD